MPRHALAPTAGHRLGAVAHRLLLVQRPLPDIEDGWRVKRLFAFLQILTATFSSFAHGGNDVR